LERAGYEERAIEFYDDAAGDFEQHEETFSPALTTPLKEAIIPAMEAI